MWASGDLAVFTTATAHVISVGSNRQDLLCGKSGIDLRAPVCQFQGKLVPCFMCTYFVLLLLKLNHVRAQVSCYLFLHSRL
jgi:hypothetical protein